MTDTARLPSLCLVGTSNGVFDGGYSSIFRGSDKLSSFSKNCLGFCSSALFSLMAPRLDFSTFDICVLDFAANDGVQLLNGFAQADVVETTTADAIQRLLEAGCLPALFILPVLSVFRGKDWAIQKIYLKLAAIYHLPVFDGYAYLQQQQQKGVDIAALFLNDMHLNLPVAAQLAEYFLEDLLGAYKDRAPGENISGTGYRLSFCPAASLQPGAHNLISRKTALFAADLLEVSGSCNMQLPAAAGDEIVAIGVDWANSRGHLALSSATSSTVALTTMYAGDEAKRFIFGLYPVRPVVLADENIELLLTDDRRGPAKLAFAGLTIRRRKDFSVTALLTHHRVFSGPA